MDAFFGLFILLGVFWILLKILFGTSAKPKKLPPEKAGWVYVIERDGHLKIGRCDFKYNEEKPVRSLVNRMEEYINNSITPNTFNVDIVYFHLFDNHEEVEKQLKTDLDDFAQTYENLVTSKVKYDEVDKKEKILKLIKVPDKREWYEYKTSYKEMYDVIRTWFDDQKKLDGVEYHWIFDDTKRSLLDSKQVFIHEFPEAKLSRKSEFRIA